MRLARQSRGGDERADVVEIAAVEVERAAERDELEGVVALVRLAAGALARRRAEAREAAVAAAPEEARAAALRGKRAHAARRAARVARQHRVRAAAAAAAGAGVALPDRQVLARVAPGGQRQPLDEAPPRREIALEGGVARVAAPLADVRDRVAAERTQRLLRSTARSAASGPPRRSSR